MNPKKELTRITRNELPTSFEIVSITVISDIIPCMAGEPVRDPSSPNWSQELVSALNDGLGSIRPGVFLLQNPGSFNGHREEITSQELAGDEIEMVMEIFRTAQHGEKTQQEAPKASTLALEVKVNQCPNLSSSILIGQPAQALYGKILFSGSLATLDPALESPQKLFVTPISEPQTFTRIWGDLTWSIVSYDSNTGLVFRMLTYPKTRIEFFWIFDYPGNMYKKGVWIEVLRILHQECFALIYRDDIIRRVVNYCHSGTGLRYDSYIFSKYYVDDFRGGAFDLGAYLKKTFPFLNCYDQAAVVQVFLAALGIGVKWGYISPFGFLNETNLLGRGLCNNPDITERGVGELVPTNDPARLPFGNHCFCILARDNHANIILDATAGPHLGYTFQDPYHAGGEQTYLSLSIDGMTALYETSPITSTPGRLNDIRANYPGVIDVYTVSLCQGEEGAYPPSLLKSIHQFKIKIGLEPLPEILDRDPLIYNWQDPEKWLQLEAIPDFKRFENYRIGVNICVRQWSFLWEYASVNIQLFVSTQGEIVREQFIKEVFSSNNPPIRLKKFSLHLELGYLSVVANYPYYSVFFWYYRNVLIKLTTYNPPLEPPTLMAMLEEKLVREPLQIEPPSTATLASPAITQILLFGQNGQPFSGVLLVDQTITFEITANPGPFGAYPSIPSPDALKMEFFPQGKSVVFEKEETQLNRELTPNQWTFGITFRARTPGITRMGFVVSDTYTMLNSRYKEFSINVEAVDD